MDTYYFVTWSHIDKRTFKASNPSNTILHNTHPVEWAARQVPTYDEFFLTSLLFWAEIPEVVAIRAKESGWIGIQS